mmetsp:Transcript_34126/g.94361  ORF Transcript_34126/g.94361 Transcript_34126/m.94361 type:complete len:462 (-) Transcript_34126:146-1531(-)
MVPRLAAAGPPGTLGTAVTGAEEVEKGRDATADMDPFLPSPLMPPLTAPAANGRYSCGLLRLAHVALSIGLLGLVAAGGWRSRSSGAPLLAWRGHPLPGLGGALAAEGRESDVPESLEALPPAAVPVVPASAEGTALDASNLATDVARVACVGDSITAGLYASSSEMSYPSQLQRLLGPKYTVLNFGESGATLTRGPGMSYWDSPQLKRSIDSKPDIVIIMLGTNDAAKATWCTRHDNFVPVYDELINVYLNLESKPQVYIAEPPPMYRGGTYVSYFFPSVVNRVYPDLLPQIACAPTVPLHGVFRTHCPLASEMTELSTCEWLVADGVHPNDVGYGVIAKTVMETIVQSTPPSRPGVHRVGCLNAAATITQTRGGKEAACGTFFDILTAGLGRGGVAPPARTAPAAAVTVPSLGVAPVLGPGSAVGGPPVAPEPGLVGPAAPIPVSEAVAPAGGTSLAIG